MVLRILLQPLLHILSTDLDPTLLQCVQTTAYCVTHDLLLVCSVSSGMFCAYLADVGGDDDGSTCAPS